MKHLTKLFRATIAIAMMLCVALPTLAHDFEVGGIYYDYLDQTAKTVEVTYKGDYYDSYSNEYTDAVAIPSSVTYNSTTYSVTSIGYYAFRECTGLTSVTIPNSVTEIGYSAFNGCSGLTEVNITDLSAWCKIDFGGYSANPLYYANKLKLNGTEIKDLVIPNDITEIKDYAFNKCSGLTSVTIPNSVTSIGEDAFNGCTGLTEVTIPNSVTSIGSYAFLRCTGLTSIVVENGNSKYDSRDNCNAIVETATNTLIVGCKNTTIPNSVTSIGSSAFSYCTGLTSVTIPNSVTSIDDGAFRGCTGLTSVTIPNSVTSIDDGAFRGCDGLTSVTIPNSVTSIGEYAFYNCSRLTEVNITDLSAWCKIDFGGSSANPLYYAKKLKLNGTEIKDLVIPNDITKIKFAAFYNCSGLTSVTIGNSVTSIGTSAFSGCTGLTEVAIGNSVTSIGTSAFSGCTGLTSVTIPNSVTSIGSYAFYGCTGLTSVTIGNSVTSIGWSAFEDCIGLTSVTIPNSVTYIGGSAFSGCTGLTEVNISDLSAWCKIDFYDNNSNPLYYANKLKLNGTEIKDLVIPNDITEIKDYAFYYCSGLTSVTIPNSVTTIGDYAFYYCDGLTSITIPNSVTSIGSEAFRGCSGLTSVTIPNSVTSIGTSAFSGCTGLTEVAIGNSVTSIGTSAFSGCTGLTSVTIPNSVTSIGSYAFYYCRDLETIVSLNSTPPTCVSSDSFDSYNYSEATLYVPKDSYAKYFKDEVWGLFSNITKIETTATSISLNKSSLTLDKGATEAIKASITPSNTTLSFLYWTSDNPTVATVDQSGKITAISAGTATITAMAIDGSNVSASCVVTVGVGGIEGVEADDNAIEVARYDIHGRLLSKPARGFNIVIYSDGTTRKEIVK